MARPRPRSAPEPTGRRTGIVAAVLAALTVLVAAVAAVAAPAPVGASPSAADDQPPGSGTTVPGPPGTAPPLVEPGSPTPRDEAVASCLGAEGPVVDVEADAQTPYPDRDSKVDPFTVFDARGSRFDNSDLTKAGFGFGVRLRGNHPDGICIVGGSIRTTLDPEGTPWKTWHRVAGIEVNARRATIVGTTLRNQGDLVIFLGQSDGWSVIGVGADGGQAHPGAYAHDDCIENDLMLSGRIIDSKFDGCFSFLSSTHASPKDLDGSDETVEVRGTLVRLQPFENSFNVEKYGPGNHGGFFKWASTDSDVMIPPSLTVTDSIFRADQKGRFGGNKNGILGLPAGTRCERVMLIGTEVWPERDLQSWIDQCQDLRFGTEADWDAAVEAWDAAHPPLRDLAGQGRDVVPAALGW